MAENNFDLSFQNSVETDKALKEFLTKYATHKSRSITNKCRELNQKAMEEIRRCFIELGLKILTYYLGSVYEATNLESSYDGKVEFDVSHVYVDDNIVLQETDIAGYCLVRPKDAEKLPDFLKKSLSTSGGYIDRKKFIQQLYSVVQKCVNKSEVMQTAKLALNGPAIALSIDYPPRNISFKTDVVLLIGPRESAQLCVAKPPKWRNLSGEKEDDGKYWKITMAIKMTKQMDIMESFAKDTYRVLKAIRVVSTELHQITSYYLKMLVVRNYRGKKLKPDSLAHNVFVCLKDLSYCLKTGNLPCYFNEEDNLFQNLSPTVMEKMKNRIDNLIRSKTAFYKLLQYDSK